ncbi:hypothetical protein L249_8338 [Ophiocordyceps polyrhachis-furcata BCC 54312]|uniref:Uncharacterized protein n=1 Tax=Ophiocordyceps polyrhachis-furcata BCC 54312 TaxID=1330021 RepID=A0A367KZA6_9HYPO|nr:hypothetical protein L249_8338 [Ophiocordyceps polyrhachis-furcata BCC 54312]
MIFFMVMPALIGNIIPRRPVAQKNTQQMQNYTTLEFDTSSVTRKEDQISMPNIYPRY